MDLETGQPLGTISLFGQNCPCGTHPEAENMRIIDMDSGQTIVDPSMEHPSIEADDLNIVWGIDADLNFKYPKLEPKDKLELIEDSIALIRPSEGGQCECCDRKE